jgi:hypothetical protein
LRGGYWYNYNTLPANLLQGTWHVGIEINGTEMTRDSFQVTAGGAGAAHVSQGSTYVDYGRTTPIDFGIVSPGSTLLQTFTVSNLGSATLTLSNLTLPSGFAWSGDPRPFFSSSLAPGGSAQLRRQRHFIMPEVGVVLVRHDVLELAPISDLQIGGFVAFIARPSRLHRQGGADQFFAVADKDMPVGVCRRRPCRFAEPPTPFELQVRSIKILHCFFVPFGLPILQDHLGIIRAGRRAMVANAPRIVSSGQ